MWFDSVLRAGVGFRRATLRTVRIEVERLGSRRWKNVNPAAARRLYLTDKGEAVFGPTKTAKPSTVDISAGTVALLRDHRRAQAELKMKNRASYRDLGL